MKDEKSVRFQQEQVSAFSGNNCPLSSGFSVRNRRNMHKGQIIDTDTINTNLGDEFSIKIYSQYQPECELIISERVDENSLYEITDLPDGASLKGYYQENGIEKTINEITVNLSESEFKEGDIITYITEIRTSSEIKVLRQLIIKIK